MLKHKKEDELRATLVNIALEIASDSDRELLDCRNDLKQNLLGPLVTSLSIFYLYAVMYYEKFKAMFRS